MKVYRLEHSDSGKGPFTHLPSKGECGGGRFMRVMKEPEDFKHSKKYLQGVHYFGFKGAEHLLSALSDRWRLHDLGFRVVVVEVVEDDCIVYPDGQVAFVYKSAIVKTRYTIDELIDVTYRFDEVS